MNAGLYVLFTGIIVGIGCVVVAVVRVLSVARPLKKRLDSYRQLPIVSLANTTQARVASARRRIAAVPALRARARSAVLEIVGAADAVRAAVVSVVAAVRAAPGILLGL